MRPVVCIHGVSEKADARGFSQELRNEVRRQCAQLRIAAPRWSEVVWSDLSDLPGGMSSAPLDMLADVLLYERDQRRGDRIRARLTHALQSSPGCVLVAHSLGSVIALDTLAQTARLDVRSLITMGSPLAINAPALDFTTRAASAAHIGVDWLDVWSDSDPVHTGAIAGLQIVQGAHGLASAGYPCESRRVDLGPGPESHCRYWSSPQVAAWVLSAASRVGQ